MKKLQTNGLEVIVSSPARNFRNDHTFNPDAISSQDVFSPRPYPLNWTVVVDWRLKNGTTYSYFYGPGYDFSTAVIVRQKLERLAGPRPTGGFLYNLNVRPQLLMKTT